MTEQWQELKETITEMRDNDGTGTQQEVCKFLANLMDVLEKQMSDSENPNKGEWIESKERSKHWYCSVCGGIHTDPETGKWRETFDYRYPFCPNCGADMRGE